MARRLRTNREIDAFVSKVIREANHHAQGVASVIMPLSTAVRSRLSLGPDIVEVYERNGELARTCWVVLGGRRYVFRYSYKTRRIELLAGSLRGAQVAAFDNHSTGSQIVNDIGNL